MQYSTMREETRDYVTLALPALQQAPVQPTRSWKRRWNQLSRLQRGILSMVGLAIIVALVYFYANPLHVTIPATLPVPQSEKSNEKVGGVVEEPPAAGGIGNGDEGGGGGAGAEEEEEGGGGGGGISILKDEEVKQIKKVQLDNSVQADEGDKDDLAHQIAPPPGPRTRRNTKQEAVVAAMQHAWQGYKKYAWGSDHLKPVSGGRNEWLHLGLTLIDALDTLWIMDLKEEFNQAREWVATEFTLDLNQEVNLFETTIRVLGGLLSTYHLSKDNLFLEKAIDLGDRLLPCFDSPSGIPYSDVNLMTRRASKPKWGPDSSTSEVTTIQLELRDLSRVTGSPIYEEKADFVTQHIHKLPKTEGLVPIFINAASGQWRPHATVTLGARGDSYYEYLLKQWVQTGRTRDMLRDDFNESVSGMEHLLARRSEPNKLLFFGELHGGGKNFVNKMDELTCYLPGTLVLGVHFGMPKHHLDIAKDLLNTCVQTWLQQPTHLAPEITYFNTLPSSTEDLFVKSNDAHYLLRPETIESLWYMYHFTGNKIYQDWGWQIFQGIEKHCKTEHGYTSIGNVRSIIDVKPRDKMESFFLGETLKYFYLLFSDDQKTYSLDKWVFNSEAHLFPMYDH